LNTKAITAEVASWPIAERIRLIDEIWQGITSAEEATILDEAKKRDLEQRLEAYRDAPLQGSTWQEVESRLRGAAL
jgi:putative addiction module component (TIGR02574 family)